MRYKDTYIYRNINKIYKVNHQYISFIASPNFISMEYFRSCYCWLVLAGKHIKTNKIYNRYRSTFSSTTLDKYD